jgi:mannosyltransferase
MEGGSARVSPALSGTLAKARTFVDAGSRLPPVEVVGEALTRRQIATTRWATPAMLVAAGLTVVGLALRLVYFDQQSLFADDLSTAWIVTGEGLGEAIDRVQTDQEITPPLFFVVTWLTAQLGDSTAWLQLPSVVFGTVTIPLVCVLGVKTVGRGAGLVGAALTALSPYQIFFSTEARAYAMVLMLVLLSTLALLTALDTGRRRWWAAYAALSCAVMYTHYTGAFVLLAQALWALWAHRESWRPLLAANGIAAIGFLPWLPSYIDDSEAPTTHILEIIHPFGLELATTDVVRWAVGFPVGFPFRPPGTLPGTGGLLLLAAGLAIAIGWLGVQPARRGVPASGFRPSPRVVLVVLLAMATPVGAGLYSLVGTDVFASRNLIASWPGTALLFGALVTAVTVPVVRAAAVALVLSAYCIGTVKLFDDDFRRPDYDSVAQFIDSTGQPGDPVVDIPVRTGGPITALEGAVGERDEVFVLGMQPRLPGPVEINELPRIGEPGLPPESVVRPAVREARGRRLFISVPDGRPAATATQEPPRAARVVVRELSPGSRLVGARHYPGLIDLSVYRYEGVGR